MSDGEALLAAILANPDDDAPRLVYADWLEENVCDVPCLARYGWNCKECNDIGHISIVLAERAEFIRVQCEIFRTMPAKHADRCHCKGCKLRHRERELATADIGKSRLVGPFPLAVKLSGFTNDANVSHAICTRGFPSAITCTTADFLANIPALFAMPIEKVTLSDKRPDYGPHVRPLFWWYGHGEGRNSLPENIFHLHLSSSCQVENFNSEQAALDALSAACVNYGRAAVGLPLLSQPGIKFSLPDPNVGLPLVTINYPEHSGEPDDAVPAAPRESAAQRARQFEFTGRHRRPRN